MPMNNDEETIKFEPPKIGAGSHFFLFVCSLLCVSFALWAYYGKLDIVSMADGRVVPSSKVKSIQHLEGGIVREILVEEGDEVKVGQPLLILEETTSGADVEELRLRIVALKSDIARLRAMAGETKEPDFPADLMDNHPELVKHASTLFSEQMKRHESDLSGQRELIKQRTHDINGLEKRIENSRKSLELLEKQIAISSELLKDQLTTEYKHLDFLREAARLKSNIDEDQSSLKKARAALKESEERLKRIEHFFLEETGEELKKARQELQELTQRFKKFTDSLKRTTVRSPVEGIVKTLYVVTVKGVIKPGMTILDIVPAADRLVVEARLPIGDIGYVQPGQKAIVKLASRDARRFGSLEGEVVHVSPDAYTSTQGGAFYTVRVETEKDYFENESLKYKLYPGVTVLAYIHTGKRTVIEYLLDPFLNTLGQSLQER
jgi:adhesin transport system membrane fusion protein